LRLDSTGAKAFYDANNYSHFHSAGMDIYHGGDKMAIFGTTTAIGSTTAVTTTSTDKVLRVETKGVNLFYDSTTYTHVSASGMSIYSGSATAAAQFGSKQTTIGPNTGFHTKITPGAIEMKKGATPYVHIASSSTFGVAGTTKPYIELDGVNSTLSIKNNTTTYMSASTAGIAVRGSITATEGAIGTWTVTGSRLDSSPENSKRGMKLEPGVSIRGYGDTAHSTTCVAGKYSFVAGVVAPPAGGDGGWDGDFATIPGGDITY
jgi:hypothetical protein